MICQRNKNRVAWKRGHLFIGLSAYCICFFVSVDKDYSYRYSVIGLGMQRKFFKLVGKNYYDCDCTVTSHCELEAK